jgi:hypothetical protein
MSRIAAARAMTNEMGVRANPERVECTQEGEQKKAPHEAGLITHRTGDAQERGPSVAVCGDDCRAT